MIKNFVCCGSKNICAYHERMRDAEAASAVASEGVDPKSEEADDIRRQIGEHGRWRLTNTPCGV